MKNLLKSDFYRAIKDKALLIGLIITIGLVVFQAGTSKLFVLLAEIPEMGGQDIGTLLGTSGLSLWFNGISLIGNTTQYIIPIFLSIFFLKEFRDRTIRNKLIMGYTRVQIYFSIIIVHAVLSLVFYLSASLTGIILGTLFFGLGTAFSVDALLTLIVGFVLEYLLSYVLIGFAIIFAINKQSMVLGILIPLIVAMVFSIFAAIAMFAGETFTQITSFFNFYQATELQGITSLSDLVSQTYVPVIEGIGYYLPLNPLLRILITAPITIIAEIFIGYARFKKIQFK